MKSDWVKGDGIYTLGGAKCTIRMSSEYNKYLDNSVNYGSGYLDTVVVEPQIIVETNGYEGKHMLRVRASKFHRILWVDSVAEGKRIGKAIYLRIMCEYKDFYDNIDLEPETGGHDWLNLLGDG